MSNSLQPHGLQHARFPCPSLSPRVYSNSCPLSWWCYNHLILLSTPSAPTLNLSQHQGLPIRWPKYRSYSFSFILPMNIQGWFPLGLTDFISLLSKGLSRVFSFLLPNDTPLCGQVSFETQCFDLPQMSWRKKCALYFSEVSSVVSRELVTLSVTREWVWALQTSVHLGVTYKAWTWYQLVRKRFCDTCQVLFLPYKNAHMLCKPWTLLLCGQESFWSMFFHCSNEGSILQSSDSVL